MNIAIIIKIGHAQAGEPGISKAVWVFLAGKDSREPSKVSPRAQARRSYSSSPTDYSWYDLPVNPNFIDAVAGTGAVIRVRSRWLNAVSIKADSSTLKKVEKLPFVKKILKASSYRFALPPIEKGVSARERTFALFDYGPSYRQVALIGIDSLHALGFSGAGQLIGVMDTGFDINHPTFTRLRAEGRIMASWDFINGDSDVVDQPDAQRFHGTAVLSEMAGYEPGQLVGAAYGASYVLAKTEILAQEIRAEEDYWVAAAEWMESLGVDIISSSLGYIDWYDTTQLDGYTPIVTQAAEIAASLGVIVVNAAGNEGNTEWHKVIPPADGDSVIAVGGVDTSGVIVNFSSRGPTADGRIKPDLCALGAADYLANYTGGYVFSSGTSFAAPLVAGGIALLQEAHPEWRYIDIITALKRASSRSAFPDNNYGWGIPDFTRAHYGQPFELPPAPRIIVAPHPAVDSVIFKISFPQGGLAQISVHEVSGARVAGWEFPVERPSEITRSWDGENSHGEKVASGIYICSLKIGQSQIREKFFLIRQ